ncbi:MAG: hypothetical protein ABFS56_31140 [Pseudomonadota bacterium]
MMSIRYTSYLFSLCFALLSPSLPAQNCQYATQLVVQSYQAGERGRIYQ